MGTRAGPLDRRQVEQALRRHLALLVRPVPGALVGAVRGLHLLEAPGLHGGPSDLVVELVIS